MFFFLATGLIVLPQASVLYLYPFFAAAMLVSYAVYYVLKRLVFWRLRRKGSEALYPAMKRRIELVFITFAINIVVIFIAYGWTHTLYPKLLASDDATQAVIWTIVCFAFFFTSLIGLRSGWDEQPGPGHYKAHWW
ncbi:MAG: hypothetical protein WDN67_01010 [Candidatus Moraniibacteriota bacterium]